MNYKKCYTPKNGYTPICKIGECSLKKLEFGIIELDSNEVLDYNTNDKETAFIVLCHSVPFVLLSYNIFRKNATFVLLFIHLKWAAGW